MRRYLALTKAAAGNKTSANDDSTTAEATFIPDVSSSQEASTVEVSDEAIEVEVSPQAGAPSGRPSIILFRSDESRPPTAANRAQSGTMEAQPAQNSATSDGTARLATYRAAMTRARVSSSLANQRMSNLSLRDSIEKGPTANRDNAPSGTPGFSGATAQEGGINVTAASTTGIGGRLPFGWPYVNATAVQSTHLTVRGSGELPNPIAIYDGPSGSQAKRLHIDAVPNLTQQKSNEDETQSLLNDLRQIEARVASLKKQVQPVSSTAANTKKRTYHAQVMAKFKKRRQRTNEKLLSYLSAKRGLAAMLDLPIEEFRQPLVIGLKNMQLMRAVSSAEVSSPNELIEVVLKFNKRLGPSPTARFCYNCWFIDHCREDCPYPPGLVTAYYCHYCKVNGHNNLECNFLKD